MSMDSWQETCLVAISAQGGADVAFQALTETVDIDNGEKDIEGVALVNGGRVAKWTPESDATITLEAYPVSVGKPTGDGFFQLLYTSTDAAQPLLIAGDHSRAKYRMAILWTNDPTVTSATAVTTGSYEGMRMSFADGYFTSVKPSFTDGILKFTITFKVTAFDKAAATNKQFESTDGTGVLPALAAYTETNNF